MNVSEQINSVIDNLSTKLGVATKELYPILLKQARINGVMDIVFIALSVLALIVCSILLYQFYIKKFEVEETRYSGEVKTIYETRSADWELLHMGFWFPVSLAVIISSSVSVCCFIDGINAFLNPQWYVIKEILSKITG